MGCIQSKNSGTKAGTKEESARLTRSTAPPQGAPSSLNRLSAHIPTTGPVSGQEYWHRLDLSPQNTTIEQNGLKFTFAFVSQRGFYPDARDKPNQDAVCIKREFGSRGDQHFFGVFDGHGTAGEKAAQYARVKVAELLAEHPSLHTKPQDALQHSLVTANEQMHDDEDVDDSMSGTTAIACLIQGKTAYIANVGDSRAIVGIRNHGQSDQYTAQALSYDHTPFRQDECDRVKGCGASVQTLDQVEGLKDKAICDWNEQEDSGDPPRLWEPGLMYPGTAFTRSLGDSVAERIGVIAEPEIEVLNLGPEHAFIVVASDGVFEFLDNDRVIELVSSYSDPLEGAIKLVVESFSEWLSYETRTDDISAIVIMIEPSEKVKGRSSKLFSSKSVPHHAASRSMSNESVQGLESARDARSTVQKALQTAMSNPNLLDSRPQQLNSLRSTRLRDVIEMDIPLEDAPLENNMERNPADLFKTV